MSALAVKQTSQAEHIVNRLLTRLASRYPLIRAEVDYDPPDEGDVWVTLHGAADADELDEIRSFGHEVTMPAWDDEGILVLILSGDYRDERQPVYPPVDQAAIQEAIQAYQQRQAAEQR